LGIKINAYRQMTFLIMILFPYRNGVIDKRKQGNTE
jgi:hypothetical protein